MNGVYRITTKGKNGMITRQRPLVSLHIDREGDQNRVGGGGTRRNDWRGVLGG